MILPFDTIVEGVRQDLLERSKIGIAKYNSALDQQQYSLKQWLIEAYHETLDKANYLKAAITKLENEEPIQSAPINDARVIASECLEPSSILLCSNGTNSIRDSLGNYNDLLPKNWFIVYIEYIVSMGFDPRKIKITGFVIDRWCQFVPTMFNGEWNFIIEEEEKENDLKR